MIRPAHIWTLFGLCLMVVLATLVWLTVRVVRLERAEAVARREAAAEESVRLALWRMDSALAPLIARESGRPYFVYSAFYPAERAYTRMFNEIEFGEVLVPSPLLTEVSPYVRLYFQIAADGEVTSPQVPGGDLRRLAVPRYVENQQLAALAARLAKLREMADPEALAALLPLQPAEPVDVVRAPPAVQGQESARQGELAKQQARRNVQEIQARQRAVQQLNTLDNNLWAERVWSGDVNMGMLKPMWVGGELLLARRVAVNGGEYVQGCWLDWSAIEPWLCSEIADLFPRARLQPVAAGAETFDRVLAGLPIRLVPGPAALTAADASSPWPVPLLIAWFCVLLAGMAVVVLLIGTVSMSERRAAFVSAVTHELRTPLTTFRLYTEMLAEGMVPDEDKRRRYLSTLQAEASRLSHLVENVLAYARLKRGRATVRTEPISFQELLETAHSRLRERANQSGLSLALEPLGAALDDRRVRADPSAVEQILLNLVDNACKYAADGNAKRIDISPDVTGAFAVLRVRDHGPGISAADSRRLFRPFHKSARDAANSAPGVGLGLALSRRLARAMGGDLRLVAVKGVGAGFELLLPLA